MLMVCGSGFAVRSCDEAKLQMMLKRNSGDGCAAAPLICQRATLDAALLEG